MQNQTAPEFVKLMDRGMMVIPQKMRRDVGLKKGDYIRVMVRNDEIVLKPYIFPEEMSNKKKEALKIRKSLISKKEGLKILSRPISKKWTDEDVKFYHEGRKMIEKRLQEYDNI